MNRKIRLSGIALVLSLVASMAVAAGAQAGNFSATEYPATIAGSPTKHDFNTSKFAIRCEKGSFGGTLKEASPTLTISPEYSDCRATFTVLGTWVNAVTTVSMNGCTYTYHDETTDSKTVSTGSATLNCPAGKQIEYAIYEALVGESHAGKPVLCTLGVGPQGPLSGITYTNNPESKITDVHIATSLKLSIKIVTGGLGSCGPIVPGATYVGFTTQTAKNGKSEAISLKAG
jgi:hypothetical protein